MVTITGNGPSLQEPADSGLPETIEIEGKTVAAFYRNPTTGDFDDYLPELQLMGGFLMTLPEQEVPASLAKADYYLVLTASYERGDYDQTAGGKNTAVRQVNSSASVDLYDAATGAFLRHLGNVLEEAPDTVYASYDEESLQYKEFTTGMYIYTADDGEQFVMAKMTVKNVGLKSDTFLPMIYYVNEDPIVQVADSSRENLYDCVNVLMHSACLNNTTLDAGASKDGDLIFEIPEGLANSGETLYLAVSLGNQIVYYPLL